MRWRAALVVANVAYLTCRAVVWLIEAGVAVYVRHGARSP